MTFHEDTLNGFQVTERTRFCDGQTWTDDPGKNNMSANPKVCLCVCGWVGREGERRVRHNHTLLCLSEASYI